MLGQIKRGSGRRHLDDGRSVQNGGVGEGRVGRGAGDEDVRLAHGRSRDDGRDHVAPHRRHDGCGAQTAYEDDEEGRRQAALDAEGEGHARGGGDTLGRGQGGEGHDGERGVGARAGLDEGRGEGVDGVKAERGAVWIRGRDLPEVEALDGRVERFSDKDRARDTEIGFAADEAGAAEVGGCADALEHRRESDERFRIGVREVICAGCDWHGARSSQS